MEDNETYTVLQRRALNEIPRYENIKFSTGPFEGMKTMLNDDGYVYLETQAGQDIYLHKNKEGYLATLGPVKRKGEYFHEYR